MEVAIPPQLKKQQDDIDAALQKVRALRKQRTRTYGDRVYYPFVGEVFFAQTDNVAQDIIFQIPAGSDYVAERLAIYPAFKFTTPDEAANGPPEVSYRPCILSSTMYAFVPNFQGDRAAVDCAVSITETFPNSKGEPVTRQLQNLPTPSGLFYSSPINYRSADFVGTGAQARYNASFEFPSAMVFPKDYLLPAASSLTCKVAPLFASVRSEPNEVGGDPTLQNEYRLTLVLEGYKVVP
jgi:hypothetical protein